MNWYLHVLKNYVNFDGRARRQEYWMFFLINLIIVLLLMIPTFLGTFCRNFFNGFLLIFSILNTLYVLGILIPSIAVGVRRLHDIGKSGWWLFISFIPIIGIIWIIILLVTDGIHGDNQYGPDPKGNIIDMVNIIPKN